MDSVSYCPDKIIMENEDVFQAYSKALGNISRLNGLLEGLPNADILVEAIPIQESWTSCGIENIVTSQDEAFKALTAGEGESGSETREIKNYRAAIDVSKDFSPDIESIERICSCLKGKEMHIRSTEKDQVYLRDQNGNIMRTPPAGTEVPGLLKELFQYMDRPDVPALQKVSTFHAVFETIHPFMDGNGRTGRILIEALLRRYGLLDTPVLFMSRFLLDNRRYYYRNLMKVQRDGNWKDWTYFFFEGVNQSSLHTIGKIIRMRESLEDTKRKCKTMNCYSDELIDLLYSHVYVRSKNLVEAGIASRNTATKYLKELESEGILLSESAGKGSIYLNRALFDILSSSMTEQPSDERTAMF